MVTEHDSKQNMSLVTQEMPPTGEGQDVQEPLQVISVGARRVVPAPVLKGGFFSGQVWVSIPSFYAEVLSSEEEKVRTDSMDFSTPEELERRMGGGKGEYAEEAKAEGCIL
jgi:hypothetical protein